MEEVFEGKNGEWYYRIKGENGETLAVSEGYASKYNAERGLETLMKQWDEDFDRELNETCAPGACEMDPPCPTGRCDA